MNRVTTADQPYPATVGLVSVNVGLPELIGKHRGKPITSGIRKRPIAMGAGAPGEIQVGRTNLAGDGQADLRVHGGPDKAVYAYPSEHLPWWNDQLPRETPFEAGSFGENLTTAGIDEAGARIGDVWRWGTALLQVCQPRYPCFKLVLATAQPDMVKRFLTSGRSGWYLRVLEEGPAPVGGPITVVETDPDGVTVAEAARAALPGADPASRIRVAETQALAASWREIVGF